MTIWTAKPGSPEAVSLGCRCPVMDNAHGKGSGQTDENGRPLYWISRQCPLHGGNNLEIEICA